MRGHGSIVGGRQVTDSGPHEHCVAADILEDLEGRTDAAHHAAIRGHLAQCPACRNLHAQLALLREDVHACHARHIRPERLLALADGAGPDPTDDEDLHLEVCDLCRMQLDELATLPTPSDIVVAQAGRRRLRAWMPRLAWSLASAMALLLLFISLRAPDDSGARYGDLARIAPIEINAGRAGGVETGFAAHYRLGLQQYAAGDYRGARAHLQMAVELAPEHAVAALLLGSTELLADHPEEARRWLARAAELAPDPAIREEALWQLVNAHLLCGDARRARARCEELQAQGLLHDADARKLLAALRALEDE